MTTTGTAPQTDLLPADALVGLRIGVSVSESSDLARLGLLETHFRLALGEIARCVVVSGGKLSYAGRIDPNGYTSFLVKELQRFHRRDRPLLVSLSLPEHRSLSQQELQDCRTDMGLFSAIECLDETGSVITDASAEGANGSPIDDSANASALTAMRRRLASFCNARVILGGRRAGYIGSMPGLVEEALLSIEAGKPFYLAGGFGGVTLDIAKTLGVDDGAWFPSLADDTAADPGLVASLKQLTDAARDAGWTITDNGLSLDENRKLSATHRPSEIAALVSLGLGRRFHAN